MPGTWESQNKVLPGAYINIRTNEPLSIMPGERGTVVLLQELSTGVDKSIYTITVSENNWPAGVDATDRKLAEQALKKAKTVLVYKLPENHTKEHVEAALASLKTTKFQTLCYPYDKEDAASEKEAVAAFIQTMREDEGVKCQGVLANYEGDYEGIINVVQGIVLSDESELTAGQTAAWVAGATAGAGMTTSNTGMVYKGAIDVLPRMTKTEMEKAVNEGKFIFKVDAAQNVSAVYDINSLTSVTVEKGQMFQKNRVVRTIDNIANDVAVIFESNYVGKTNNNAQGRSLLKASLVDYFNTLQNMGAIQNFEPDDVTVAAGADTDAVVVNVAAQPVDSVEKIYITVDLS